MCNVNIPSAYTNYYYIKELFSILLNRSHWSGESALSPNDPSLIQSSESALILFFARTEESVWILTSPLPVKKHILCACSSPLLLKPYSFLSRYKNSSGLSKCIIHLKYEIFLLLFQSKH